MNKYLRIILDPQYRFSVLSARGMLNHLSDEAFLKKAYRLRFKKALDLDDPQTFNEKLQWLKLYNRKPVYSTMVDKFASKAFVAERIGAEYVVPALGGPWKSFDEIDFDALPDKFVLKTNHDSGGVTVCRDKSAFDKEKARDFFEKHLARNYYWSCREWPYKDVKPCIFAEEYMQDGDREFLPVYKILCFGGEPRIIQTIQNDKQPNETIDYFDTEWKVLPFRQNFPNSEVPLGEPEKLEEMLSLARQLSAGHACLRVDFYVIGGRVYFSEFTFYSDAGFAAFHPEEWDKTLGSWITLPEKEEAVQ